MTHAIKTILVACAWALVIGGCSSAPVETAEAKPDLRQREEVSRNCFQSQIKDWRPNNHRSLIVRVKSNDEFKLQLIGACNPRDNQLSLAFTHPEGGARVQSDSTRMLLSGLKSTQPNGSRGDSSCSIQKIYRWERGAGNGFGPLDLPLSPAMPRR